MANNFRKTGDYYVSKEGSDANSGLTPDLPKLTLQAVFNLVTTSNKKVIIGSGNWSETVSRTFPATGVEIYGDGVVVFDGNLTNSFLLSNTNLTLLVQGIAFKNTVLTFSGTNTFKNCSFVNCTIIHASNTTAQNYCNFINSRIIPGGTGVMSSTYSIYINSTSGYDTSSNGLNLFLNNYVDSTSVLKFNSGITAANFNFNLSGLAPAPVV